MELTDLEICKRIAEIKDLSPAIVDGKLYTRMGLFDLFDLSRTHRANKLSRFVFDLIFEFGVCIHHGSGDVFICGGDSHDGCLSVKTFDVDCDLSLRKAILLCIIESK